MNEIHPSIQFLHDTPMGLGAWAWGDRIVWNYNGETSDSDIRAAFQTSLEMGITLIDTAEVYGNGRSERLLGQFLAEKPGSNACTATKFFPLPWRWTKNSVTRALRASLERMGQEKTDLYQIHWPSPLIPIETYAAGLVAVHRAGLARAVGVSNYDQNQMQRAITLLARHDIPLASNQVEYNLLNRKIEKNGLLARCQELGVRVIAYSPLAMGLLTGKYSLATPPPGIRNSKYASLLKNLPPLLKLMAELGQDLGGKTPAQIAINWAIAKGSLPIPGAKNARQAEMNAGALGWQLTPEQIQALDQASEKIHLTK